MLNSNFILILLGNVILGSALPMLILLGVLSGAWLAPMGWLATAPPSISMLAGIAVASPLSLFMGRYGRRMGFLLGAGAQISGAGLAVVALVMQNFILLCLAHAALGCALICVNYFRFAAAEAVSEAQRPQAISFTLASGLVAALIGPELFSWSKDALAPTPLAGAYATIALLGVLGALPVLGLRMRPVEQPVQTTPQFAKLREIVAQNPKVLVAIGVAALSQAIMVLLMTPTPLAMIGCDFVEDQAADVIRWHVVAMFAPGFVSGALIKRFGAERVAISGLALILFSALVALSGVELMNFYSALIVLGVGWNFGFVSGTYMLQSALSARDAPLVQGANDTLLAISATTASLLSGALYAGIGWLGLAAFSLPLSLLFCFILLRANRRTMV
ncbi:MFS transporter [Roseobacter cerasinus]|uniref:MFS transporter n=1 Tax=Roseobacter cerasinus TaxID=2602289 RepID=A0A640VZL8_9RHOB|nr:MFS transporter [Roseobacter cerasinus]GFE52365.1 MFS transporter [Roseobacter cerasinus]